MSNFPELAPFGTTLGDPDPKGWDRTVLGPFVLPGRSRPRGHSVGLKEDPKKAKGKSGANPTYHGLDPKHFVLDWVVWSQRDLDRMDEICAQIVPQFNAHGQAGTAAIPVLVIDNPYLYVIGITAVVVIDADGLEPAPEYGLSGRRMLLHLRHYLPKQDGDATKTAAGTPRRRVDNALTGNPPPSQQPNAGAPPPVTRE